MITKTEKETQKLAKQIAKKIRPGMLICLEGDLGAGKTTFTKYLCWALKIKGEILSPTFVLERQYKAKKFDVHHYDLYRLENENQLEDLQIVENLEQGDVCIIEWPEIAKNILPDEKVIIKILKLGDTERKFIIEGL